MGRSSLQLHRLEDGHIQTRYADFDCCFLHADRSNSLQFKRSLLASAQPVPSAATKSVTATGKLPEAQTVSSSHRHAPYPKTKPLQPQPSSSLTSISSNSAKGGGVSSSLRSQLPLQQDKREEINAAERNRRALSVAIDEVFPKLLPFCPIHFGALGELVECGSRCGLIDMSSYQLFRNEFRFGKYTYCYACGAPNNSPKTHYYQPPFHNSEWYQSKDACPYAHIMFKVIFALWRRDDLRPLFCEELGIVARDADGFTEWAITDHNNLQATTYFNGMTLLLWYCAHLGLV